MKCSLHHRVQENPESVPTIDWVKYKQVVPASAMAVVEKFQKEYETLKIPYPADRYTAKIEADEKDLVSIINYCQVLVF